MRRVSMAERVNVRESGDASARPIVFAHGFGCDQHMWRLVAPRFEADHRVIRFDLPGYGGAADAFDPARHVDLDAYADEVLSVLDELDLRDVVFVGHSVSAMIGVLAANRAPERFSRLVLVGPSPRYIDDGDYVGGFGEADINGLLDSLASNYLGWSSSMAPVIVGNPDRPELGEELTASFCRADPAMAAQFARVTFLSDTRADLASVMVPTLVLQCSDDAIAPVAVGQYVARSIPASTFRQLAATGHCPNLSAPDETTDAIASWLDTDV